MQIYYLGGDKILSIKEKLLNRLNSRPKDFTYQEAKTLLEYYNFIESSKGKTSGSRVAFIRASDKKIFYLHRPHPSNTLKSYIINSLIDFFEEIKIESES